MIPGNTEENAELTELLQGSTITAIAQQEKGKIELGFDSGVWIEAKTEPGATLNSSTPTGGVVETVRRGQEVLSIELAGGELVEIATAKPITVFADVNENAELLSARIKNEPRGVVV